MSIMSNKKPKLILTIGFLIIWQVFSAFYSPMVMPSPIAVVVGLRRIISDEDFVINLSLTIFRGLSGYSIALVIGTITGVLMGNNKVVYSYFQPIIQTLQAIPRVSWILLAMIWLPLNSIVVIFIMVITLFPLVAMNVYEGMQTVSKEYKEMSMVFKVSKFYIIKDLYFPSIIPFLLAASKIAAGITWKTILMAELLTVNSGIGFGMAFSKMALATDEIIAYTFIVLLIGYMHMKIVDYITSRSKIYYS